MQMDVLVHVCVGACTCVSVHIYVYMHECVCACEGQRPRSGVVPQMLPTLFFDTLSFTEIWSSMTKPGWVASGCHGFLCLSSQHCHYKVGHHVQTSACMTGTKLRFLCLFSSTWPTKTSLLPFITVFILLYNINSIIITTHYFPYSNTGFLLEIILLHLVKFSIYTHQFSLFQA